MRKIGIYMKAICVAFTKILLLGQIHVDITDTHTHTHTHKERHVLTNTRYNTIYMYIETVTQTFYSTTTISS